MVAAWPEPVERVSSYLREAGAEARIEEFAGGTPTAEDAAAAVGCELGQIVKSLVFVCDDRYVLVLVPGDRRSDPAKVATAAGAKRVKIASPAEVERATGFAPGGVAPFGIKRVETVFLDPTLLRHEIVWVGAGSPSHIVGLAPAELARVSRARAMDVVEKHPYDFGRELGSDFPGDPAQPKER